MRRDTVIIARAKLRTRLSLSTLAFPCFDGIYLPKQENEFVHHVMDDLETYQQKSNRKSALLFPPLPSRLRYLIHKTVEDLPELATFSVGESWHRRVVVCHSELRGEIREDSDLESNNSICEEIPGSGEEKEIVCSIPSRRRPRRPDKPLYMPRAARERLSLQTSQEPPAYKELSSPPSSSCISSSSDSRSCCGSTDTTCSSCTSRQESQPIVADSILNHTSESSVRCTQEEKHKLLLKPHEAEPFVLSFNDMTLEDNDTGKEYPATVPCSTQTEDITSDSDEISKEIKAHLKEAVSFSIEHVYNDYSVYENVCVNPDEFRHVIEIYDFPNLFKTDDLLDAFTEYSDGGMKIKWVDNTTALGVFSSESAALHALSICHPLLKTRALAEGSKKSKGKAIRRAEFIQPVKERPRTDCAVARRMVARALGMRGRGRVQRY